MPRARKTGDQKHLPSLPTLSGVFVLENALSPHARPSAMLVRCTSQFRCQITAQSGDEQAGVKGILGLMALAARTQSEITFTVTDGDAPQAIAEIQCSSERRFDEARTPKSPDASQSQRVADSVQRLPRPEFSL